MQIVINIDENLYTRLFDNGDEPVTDMRRACASIRKGTPLPEGHGRLGDIDKLHSIFERLCDAYHIDNLSFTSDMDMNFDLAPTIIEADKEGEEE